MTDKKYYDCFANPGGNEFREKCVILREKLCETRGNCPFYKTKQQFDEDMKRAEELFNKHYNGD